MARLVIQPSTGTSTTHEMNGDRVSIGRHPENTIVLDDISVSTRHAVIVAEEGIYVLRDLQSSNGTTINGAPTSQSAIKDGDVLAFGAVECRFHAEPAAAEPEPSTPDEAPDAQPDRKTEAEAHHSFGSKLANLGKAAFSEAKRNAHIAGIQAKLEKLKRIDMAKAYVELGKRCYELQLNRDDLAAEFNEIKELQRRIDEKRSGVVASGEETTAGMLKRSAGNVAKKAEAEGLALKITPLFAAIGRKVAGGTVPEEVSREAEDIRSIEAQMESLRLESTVSSADHSSRDEMKKGFGSLAKNIATGSKAARGGFQRRFVGNFSLCVTTLLLVVAALTFVLWPRGQRSVVAPITAAKQVSASVKTPLATPQNIDASPRMPDQHKFTNPPAESKASIPEIEREMREKLGLFPLVEDKNWKANYELYVASLDRNFAQDFEWDKEVIRLLECLDHFQELTRNSSFKILGRLEDGVLECDDEDRRYGHGRFLLKTSKTSFSSAGKALLPIRMVQLVNTKLTNGFEQDVPLYEEVIEDVEARHTELKQAELRLAKAIALRVGSKEKWRNLYASIGIRVNGHGTKREFENRASYWSEWVNSGGFCLRNVILYEYSR